MSKPIDGKKLLEETKLKVKNNQKENKEMNNKVKTAITVTVTLVVVAAFATTFFYGSQFGAAGERAKYESIKSEAKALSVVAEPKK